LTTRATVLSDSRRGCTQLHSVAITNNQVRQYSNNGILVQSSGGTATTGVTLSAIVQGNTVAEPSTAAQAGAFNGIRVVTGASSADPPTKNCITIASSVAVQKNIVTGSGTGGAAEIRLFQRFLTQLGIPGYAGANNDDAAMNSLLAGQNTVTDATPPIDTRSVSATNNTGAGGPGYFGTCPPA
jgi:hypothetical protein